MEVGFPGTDAAHLAPGSIGVRHADDEIGFVVGIIGPPQINGTIGVRDRIDIARRRRHAGWALAVIPIERIGAVFPLAQIGPSVIIAVE